MAVSGIDRGAERRTVVILAEDRNGQVLKGGPSTLPWVLEQVPRVDLRFDDAVTHFGPRQLHHDVCGAGGECPEVHGVGGRDGVIVAPSGGAPSDRDAGSISRQRHLTAWWRLWCRHGSTPVDLARTPVHVTSVEVERRTHRTVDATTS